MSNQTYALTITAGGVGAFNMLKEVLFYAEL